MREIPAWNINNDKQSIAVYIEKGLKMQWSLLRVNALLFIIEFQYTSSSNNNNNNRNIGYEESKMAWAPLVGYVATFSRESNIGSRVRNAIILISLL